MKFDSYITTNLSPDQLKLFETGIELTHDDLHQAIEDALSGSEPVLSGYLPRRYQERYTVAFFRDLQVCFIELVSRLTGTWDRPRCVGEELLIRMIAINGEEHGRHVRGQDIELHSDAIDTLVGDGDHEYLYDMAMDGIGSVDNKFGIGSLAFEDWFKPFRHENPVHPLLHAREHVEPEETNL